MKFHLLLSMGILAFMASCTPRYTYITESLLERQKWSTEDIMRIQFFVSKDITLSRTANAEQTSIKEGKIRIINGQRIEQVVIKAGTPGILVIMPKEDRFAISFEEDHNDAYLMFGPNPKYYNRFALLARDWDRDQGKVSYRGQVYQVDASSAYAALMIDLRREGQNQYQVRKIQGRVIKD